MHRPFQAIVHAIPCSADIGLQALIPTAHRLRMRYRTVVSALPDKKTEIARANGKISLVTSVS